MCVGDREIKSLSVKCSNNDINGCPWTGELRHLQDHVGTCRADLQPCQYSSIGCTAKCLDKDLAVHEQKCTSTHLKLAMEKIESLSTQLKPLLTLPNRIKELEDERNHVVLNGPFRDPPVTLKIDIFRMTPNAPRESLPFYSHPGGYKFYIRLVHSVMSVSVMVCLMRGEYDDRLVWPFRGEISFEVLNQEADEHHKHGRAKFMERRVSEKNQRVTEALGKSQVGWGMEKFISFLNDCDKKYIQSSAVYVCVTQVDISDQNKPWLIT